MSTCLKKETLLAFVDHELPSTDMESAERHVATCAGCQSRLDGIRVTSVKVDSLLRSLAPDESSTVAPAVVGIPAVETHARIPWTAVACVGVLAAAMMVLLIVRRPHAEPTPSVGVTQVPASAPAVTTQKQPSTQDVKPVKVAGHKPQPQVRKFQPLDQGEPIQTGMIYRVSLHAPPAADGSTSQSAKGIPAEVLVDEFGKVRAIRLLQ